MDFKMKLIQKLTVANALTLIRLLISPITLPFLIVYLAPFDNLFVNSLITIIFGIFAATDFFDGYYARKWGTVSQLGALLDPIADKFLLFTTLIALLAAGKIYFFWVILLIGREFFVMGLRTIALENGTRVSVSFIAKVKTFVEMIYLALAILKTSSIPLYPYELIFLWASIGCAWLSAYLYLQKVKTYLFQENKDGVV
jgi:CDP-diacylglycerol--glycerol-3-phosphate 3-phosphatidyltransferase